MCEDPGKVVEDWIGAGLRAEFRTSQYLPYQSLVEKWTSWSGFADSKRLVVICSVLVELAVVFLYQPMQT